MMNDRSGAGRLARRQPWFRLAALTAGMASAALLAVACGGSSSTGSTTAQVPTLQNMTTKALAYAQCMRSHGITNFPDPTVVDNAHEKGISFRTSGTGNSSQFKSAAKACRQQTGFGVITPAMRETLMADGLKFAECMRSHGITNFPDPVEHANNIQLGPGPGSSIGTNSAQFKAAQKACVYILPNGGP